MTEEFSDAASESQESFLLQARNLLDVRSVDSEARAAFFTSFKAILTSDDPEITLEIPQPLTNIWKDVLKLIGRYIHVTPPIEPVTADEQLFSLISRSRATPQASFAERVNTSPVRGSTPKTTVVDVPPPPNTFDSYSYSSSAEPPPVHEVDMTESDYELLQEKLQKRRESQSKSAIIAIPEGGSLPSDEVRAETTLDASAVATAISSDFKIDQVDPISDSL
jgi:hypothetical protein